MGNTLESKWAKNSLKMNRAEQLVFRLKIYSNFLIDNFKLYLLKNLLI